MLRASAALLPGMHPLWNVLLSTRSRHSASRGLAHGVVLCTASRGHLSRSQRDWQWILHALTLTAASALKPQACSHLHHCQVKLKFEDTVALSSQISSLIGFRVCAVCPAGLMARSIFPLRIRPMAATKASGQATSPSPPSGASSRKPHPSMPVSAAWIAQPHPCRHSQHRPAQAA